jgi:hypothetical protein
VYYQGVICRPALGIKDLQNSTGIESIRPKPVYRLGREGDKSTFFEYSCGIIQYPFIGIPFIDRQYLRVQGVFSPSLKVSLNSLRNISKVPSTIALLTRSINFWRK